MIIIFGLRRIQGLRRIDHLGIPSACDYYGDGDDEDDKEAGGFKRRTKKRLKAGLGKQMLSLLFCSSSSSSCSSHSHSHCSYVATATTTTTTPIRHRRRKIVKLVCRSKLSKGPTISAELSARLAEAAQSNEPTALVVVVVVFSILLRRRPKALVEAKRRQQQQQQLQQQTSVIYESASPHFGRLHFAWLLLCVLL